MDAPTPQNILDVDQVSQQLKIRPHIYVKLVKSFAESLPQKLNSFNDALMSNDRDQMRMILHEIKGTAGNLRLNTIIGPETVLHTAVKAGGAPDILLKHFDILKTESERLLQYIGKIDMPAS